MVTAVDVQQVIVQSNTAERVQQIQQQNPDMQQRHFALQLSEQDRLLKEKVKQSKESEKALIKEKQHREHSRQSKNQQSKENPELVTAGETSEFEDEGGHINIKV